MKKLLPALIISILIAPVLSGTTIELAAQPGENFIRLRQNQIWRFTGGENSGRTLLSFEHRVDFPRLGGWVPCMQIAVNGKFISSMATRSRTRLLNKERVTTHMDHGKFKVDVGEKWYSLYSPDFSLACRRFYPANPEAYRLVLDISDLVIPRQENTVQIRFGSELAGYYKSCNITDRVPALAVRNFRITCDGQKSLIPPTPQMPRAVTYKPYAAKKFTAAATPQDFKIDIAGQTVPLISQFSLPGGKWIAMGGKNSLATPEYRVSRRIKISAEKIDIFDTFTSIAPRLTGIKIKYQLPCAAFNPIWLAGDSSPANDRLTGGRNPSVFLADREHDFGIALLAQDDVFRVQNIQFSDGVHAGLMTENFALSPGESRTVELSVYPTGSPDYFDFINIVRREWDVNFPIAGGFHLSLNVHKIWTPQKAREFHDKTGLTMNSFGVLMWKHLGGQYAAYLSSLHGASFLDDVTRTRTAHDRIADIPTEPMRQFVREMLSKARAATPDVKRFIYVHNQWSTEKDDEQKYADCPLTRSNGKAWTEMPYRFFIPTIDNAFGRKFLTFIDTLCRDYDIDGIYHDEFTYTRSRTTVNMWDKVSVELDDQNRVKRRIGFVPLLKRDFNLAVMDRVINKHGKLFVANFSPETRGERRFKVPRFEETYYTNWIFLSHLYTPIQLGDMLTFGPTPRDCMADIRNAMHNGALYYHYNNQAACPTITRRMYPFTPQKIHSGYLVGRERILTARPGEFIWPGENALAKCYSYDSNGREAAADAVFASSRYGTMCRLNLAPESCAALVKIPVKAKLPPGVTLRDVDYNDGVFTTRAQGVGECLFDVDGTKHRIQLSGDRKIILRK